MRGVVDKRGGDEANLIIDELIPIEDLDSRYTHGMRLRLDEADHDGRQNSWAASGIHGSSVATGAVARVR